MTRQRDIAINILAKSEFVPSTDEEFVSLNAFLDGIKGCTWENADTPTHKRQFETSLKGHFKRFDQELIQLHKLYPPTRFGKPEPFKEIGLHSMDDQGFEGQILNDGSFYRWIKDFELEKNPGELKIKTNGRNDFEEPFITEFYKEDSVCENHLTKGAYVLADELDGIALCRECLNKTWGKENIEVVKN